MLAYQETNSDAPTLILFLHGGGVSSWMWKKQVAYFKDYHCVTVDLPEQGNNANTGPFSISDSASQIIELLENIGMNKKIVVVGFSLGSQVIVSLISQAPNLINYAMVNSALVKPSKLVASLISPMIRMSYPLIKNRKFSAYQSKELYVSEEDFETYYQESISMKPETLSRILQENSLFELPTNLSQTKTKVLITVGEKERKVMKDSAILLNQEISQSELTVIPEIGHGYPMVLPDRFNSQLELWIKE